MSRATPSAGSSRREPLSRPRVVGAAVGIADESGLTGVTMRAVAAVLSVEAMSLYNYVTGRDDLLDGMVDAVFAEIALPDPNLSWREAIRGRAVSAHEALRRHPWAIGLLDSRRRSGPATYRHHDAVLSTLRAAGFTVAMAVHAVSAIDSYVYGYALQERSLPVGEAESLQDLARSVLEDLSTGEYPHLAEVAAARAASSEEELDDEFRFGLDLILDGLDLLSRTV
ncbi:AcrR family transcriptional regulator [Microbacterium resistens]|uniref:AcrR family transcriptional regulator n=1 Tax=Microbacterium resistens TaxID=156977 RepID=A0ABU1S950_9MICO|nr:TetR/AcrR family transcriptional regulator C-terminal domain-containing protein [Microbacterium resistens]MDR6866115.1 AcrR family transcriptional regulator [Microbacterium resistens]